ncbi:hypothetical protein P7K49_003318 [Saguinus oedipus]|uniref:Protein kinase domain-containing protein n=1 Tax=Saguinus oedipus TaxID=9490 RepID=A0ABQ9WJV0_SAGOE|nr:hypothetical protein P7K49_003318 [Saguinus oedipus]
MSSPPPARSGFYRQEVTKTAWEVRVVYRDLQPVGSGAYGARVPRSSAVDSRTGAKVAIKKLYRPFQSELFAKRAYRELRLLKHMRHENVSRAAPLREGAAARLGLASPPGDAPSAGGCGAGRGGDRAVDPEGRRRAGLSPRLLRQPREGLTPSTPRLSQALVRGRVGSGILQLSCQTLPPARKPVSSDPAGGEGARPERALPFLDSSTCPLPPTSLLPCCLSGRLDPPGSSKPPVLWENESLRPPANCPHHSLSPLNGRFSLRLPMPTLTPAHPPGPVKPICGGQQYHPHLTTSQVIGLLDVFTPDETLDDFTDL